MRGGSEQGILNDSGSGFDCSPEVPRVFLHHAARRHRSLYALASPWTHSAVFPVEPKVLGTAVEVLFVFVHLYLLCVDAAYRLCCTPSLGSVDRIKLAFLLLPESPEHLHAKPSGTLFCPGLISTY